MNHRSQSLRDSANGEACVYCGAQDSTIVWCHSNEGAHGKGMSIKSHDLLGNYWCARCHHLYDRSPLPREQKRAMFRECYPKTMVRVAEKLARGEIKL